MSSRFTARERDERGAVAVYASIVLVVLLLVTALAVDIGMQRVARSDMQALADVVALDLARELDGSRTVEDLDQLDEDLAAASRDRNIDVIGFEGRRPDLAVEWGEFDDGTFSALPAAAVPTAVRVTADTEVGFVFSGITGNASGAAARDAVAQAEGGACFSIGSYAARLDTGKSPLLGPLLGALGSNVTLSAVDYNGLANADVELLDLLGVAVGAGTLESLVQADQLISLGDYYLAIAEVISQEHAVQAELLQTIAATVQDVHLQAGDLLGLDTGGVSGLDAALNVFDLVTAGAAAATGHNALSVPQASVDLGPLADVDVSLSAIEAPRPGCGRKNSASAVANSTQVRANVSADALGLDLVLAGTDVSLDGYVGVAAATGRLTDVRCAPTGITVAVADGLLEVDLRLEVTVFAQIPFIGRIPIIEGPITLVGRTTSTGDAVINIENDADYDSPTTVGWGSSGLPALTINTSGVRLLPGLPLLGGILSAVGGLLGVVDALVNNLVSPLVQGLDDALVAPLLNLLGLDISGADVYAHRVPKCTTPRLVD